MKKDTKRILLIFSVICITVALIIGLISFIPSYYDDPRNLPDKIKLISGIIAFVVLCVLVLIRGVIGTRGYYKEDKNDKL